MATSTAAATFPVIVAKTSVDSKLAHFSSPQFPAALRVPRIRKNCLKSKSRQGALEHELASKKQTFASFDQLLEKSEKPVSLSSVILGGGMSGDQLIQRIEASLASYAVATVDLTFEEDIKDDACHSV